MTTTDTDDIELHDDDLPVGRVLSRRELLVLLGGASAAILTGTASTLVNASNTTSRTALAATPTVTPTLGATPLPSCVVVPALTEGPYFVDEMLNRTDIRLDPSDNTVRDGALFNLTFRVSNVSGKTCSPLKGAQVDIWHTDAQGVYSNVRDRGFTTIGKKFLRGYQLTDAQGQASFTTIYPGWYNGRTVHIHFKIRFVTAAGANYEFTSQLFFDDSFTDAVYKQAPYSNRGNRTRRNANDGIFQGSDGLLTLTVNQAMEGYAAVFDLGIDITQLTPVSKTATKAP